MLRLRPRPGILPLQNGRRAILIRGAALGLVPYWPSASDLAAFLRTCGFTSTVINHYEYKVMARQLTEEVNTGRWQGGLFLIGYSFGADFVCLLARELAKRGINVSASVLIESTFGIPVPANVDRCINYFKTRALDFLPTSRGISVTADDPRTEMTNVNVRHVARLSELARRSHFTIGDHPLMHELVADFLLASKSSGRAVCDLPATEKARAA